MTAAVSLTDEVVIDASPGGREPAASKGTRPVSFLFAAAVGVAVRLWVVAGVAPSWWQDSYDYDAVGSNAVLSRALWLGERPPLMPMLLGATGGEPGHGLVLAQAVVAGLCWAWLAAEMATWVSCRWVATAVVACVVAFSLSDPVVMWDIQALTESLTLSLMAATTAAALRFGSTRSWAAGATLVVTATAWCLARDTVAAAMFVASFAAMIGLRRRREVVVVGGALLLVAVLSMAMASSAGRGDVPTSHLFFARVLPFPERLDWFEDRGMPRVEAFHAAVPPLEGPHIVAAPEDDPQFERWWEWFDHEGSAAWRSYVAHYPWFLVAEPVREPERVYNNGEGSVTMYRPAELPKVPVASALMWPSLLVTLAGLSIGGVAALRRSLWSGPAAVAGLLALGSGVYAAVAWHSDAMESARHVFIGGAMARLALVVLVGGLVEPVRVALRRRADI